MNRDRLIEELQAANARDRAELAERRAFLDSQPDYLCRDWPAQPSKPSDGLPEEERRAVLEWLQQGERQRAVTEADSLAALREEIEGELFALADESGSACGRLESRIVQLERTVEELRSQLDQHRGKVTPLRVAG